MAEQLICYMDRQPATRMLETFDGDLKPICARHEQILMDSDNGHRLQDLPYDPSNDPALLATTVSKAQLLRIQLALGMGNMDDVLSARALVETLIKQTEGVYS